MFEIFDLQKKNQKKKNSSSMLMEVEGQRAAVKKAEAKMSGKRTDTSVGNSI